MKRRLDLIAALTISLLVATLAVAEPVSHNMAARTELHAIESMTLSDAQFLTGDANGMPTTTTGELRVAAGSGRLPLVMLQHGSGGMKTALPRSIGMTRDQQHRDGAHDERNGVQNSCRKAA